MSTTNQLRRVLANELVFSIQMQSFHWNVRGMLFTPLHKLFEELYNGAHESVDSLAEYIRIAGELAPSCLPDIYKDTNIQSIAYVPGTEREMLEHAMSMNDLVLVSVNDLMRVLDPIADSGLTDYVSSLNDMHRKWNWKIKSHLGYV